MTTFVEKKKNSGTVPWKVGEYKHESRGRFRCRPAGRAGTDQKDDYVCTGVRISFFFFLPSVHFLPAEEDVYTGRYVFPRELNVGRFMTFLGVNLLIFDTVMLLMVSDDGCILERLLTFPRDRVS